MPDTSPRSPNNTTPAPNRASAPATTGRAPTTTGAVSPARPTPRPATGSGGYTSRPAGGPNGAGSARPAGGPNGGGGVRPNGLGAPRPAGAPGGARPGGYGAPRPAGGGRPASGGGRPNGGRPNGGRPGGGRSGAGRPGAGRGAATAQRGPAAPEARRAPAPRETGPVTIPAQIVVKDLADLLKVTVNEVIRTLISQGVFAGINQVVDYATAAKAAETLGFTPEAAVVVNTSPVAAARAAMVAAQRQPAQDPNRITRPPVITVMGHVDHGKTSLLDAIRKTRVAAGEAGGITQHIGAYQVEINGRKLTFLDTPGHEAFTAMRARGAQVTDIAVIVVAADDGVMPQTIEAIDHARAAQVPIVVALNKIDKPNANPDFVKQQLAEHDVVIEEYGGDVICVPVSAKRGLGLDDLLEMILLVADIQDLRANPKGPAQGVIIEARLEHSSGVTATALIQEGMLKVGDIVVVGKLSGKVRAMFDDTGKRIQKAPPSAPVSVLGLSEVPEAGDRLEAVADEKTARTLVAERRNEAQLAAQQNITLDTLYTQMREGKVKELNLLIKSDVQGSAEALKHALSRIGDERLKVRLIHDGIGNVSEADVHLASASKAIIIAFNVKVDGTAMRMASIEGVDIRSYDVIYKLTEDIEAALQGLLEPVYREQVDGHAEVIQLFKAGRSLIIGGCRVLDGKLTRSSQARVTRGGKVIYTGMIQTLRRGKDDVREVAQGFECGLTLEDFNTLEMGDIIEAFSKVRV